MDNSTLSAKTTSKYIYKVSTCTTLVEDTIAIEAPLEIKIKKGADLVGKSVAVTMRTPGNDIELALGFIFTEGMLKDSNEILKAEVKEENIVEILIKNEADLNLGKSDRNFYTTSSCGVCGKTSIDAVKVDSSFKIKEGVYIEKAFSSICKTSCWQCNLHLKQQVEYTPPPYSTFRVSLEHYAKMSVDTML